MPRKREVLVEVPVVYCRDDPQVQDFVSARMWDFRNPETSRGILDAAIVEFGLLPCYFEIKLH